MDDTQFVLVARRYCDDEIQLRAELLKRGVSILSGRSLFELLGPLTSGLVHAATRKAGAKTGGKKAKPAAKKPAKKARKAKKPAKAKPKTGKAQNVKTGKAQNVKTGKAQNVKTGRQDVARGVRPPLAQAMARVMGTKAMDSQTVLEALKKRSWAPRSANARQYLSFIFSSTPEAFKRIRRGLYKVRPGWPEVSAKASRVQEQPAQAASMSLH